jgi:hypothetical protein
MTWPYTFCGQLRFFFVGIRNVQVKLARKLFKGHQLFDRFWREADGDGNSIS